MPGHHELKILPPYYDAVERGDKTFEVRSNDRDFQTGDTVELREFDPSLIPPPAAIPPGQAPAFRTPGGYTGRSLGMVITYILHGGKFGIAQDAVVFGIRKNA